MGPALWAADGMARDEAGLGNGEYAVLVLDFAGTLGCDGVAARARDCVALLGVPELAFDAEGLFSARAARSSSNDGQPYQGGFGASVPGVTVNVHNYGGSGGALPGPDASHPHLELTVHPFSVIPAYLAPAGYTPPGGLSGWVDVAMRVNISALLGSSVDGPVVSTVALIPMPLCFPLAHFSLPTRVCVTTHKHAMFVLGTRASQGRQCACVVCLDSLRMSHMGVL